VESWFNETCLGLEYVWKGVGKGVMEERYESGMKNSKKITRELKV